MSKTSGIGLLTAVIVPHLPEKGYTANLLTVIQTCRRQKRSVIEFFDQAIKAMVNSAVQTPSLIPQV
jgi:hypothetical protein